MLRYPLCVAVVLFLSIGPAFGQFATAEFNGSVVDQSASVLPGVTVTLTEESTGLVRTVVTNESGRFVLPAVPPGRYTVRAELVGFQTQTRTGVTIAVGQAVTINFALPIGGLTDQITVTGESPLVEVTQTVIGTNVSQEDINSLPMQGREQMSLLALVPGLTPNLSAGSFEGTNYSANGRDTGSNLYLVDGIHNKDDRSMGFSQTRVTVDSTAEYQVLTHDYGAEYGGSAGVIVNAVTKSGTNDFRGSAFYYLQDSSLDATNHFLKLRGEQNPDSSNKSLGGNLGGPLFRNKAFFFFNYERTWSKSAINNQFPAEAAPLATSFSTVYDVNLANYFGRVDYQVTPSHTFSFRAVLGPNDGIGENAEEDRSTRENFRYERATPETIASAQWTAVLGSRLLNELKVSTTRESLWIGDRGIFNEDFNDIPFDIKGREFTGMRGRDPLDYGSMQEHPDYVAGPRQAMSANIINANTITEQLTFTPVNHTIKAGFGASTNGGTSVTADNLIGTFEFAGNLPFDPANISTYPIRFRNRVGEIFIPVEDRRFYLFGGDKWQVTNRLTLNLGIRYDYNRMTPRTKYGFQPRLGVAYAASDKMVIRGGIGKYYEFPPITVISTHFQNGVIARNFGFDTGEDTSALRGVRPAHACLNPVGDGQGRAVISPACRAQLVAFRDSVAAGTQFNNDNVAVPDERRLAYLWGFSAGVEREILPNVALRVDYVGNRGRDNVGRIDINEGPLGPDGRVTRLGASGFDPSGTLIPAAARGVSFRRVLQYQNLNAFNSDYNALELSMEKRMANRWSGRFAYTLSRARDVNGSSASGGGALVNKRVNDDRNPRLDYGLANFDNRHALTTGGNWQAWRGLGVGMTARYYSGWPVNETVGLDANRDGDGTNFDRPVRGRDDATRPILSPVDANGQALRNALEGSDKMLVDVRLQYVLGGRRNMGVYWEVYNLTNRVNFNNPIGNRRSRFFGTPIVADEARSMQLGIRYTF